MTAKNSMPKIFAFLFGINFIFLFSLPGFAQTKTINVSINFKVDEGNYDKSYLVVENVTTGEKQTIGGQAKFSVNIKFNNDYILSFNKPGYITKKIELDMSAPADRIEQGGFYPVQMTVILIKQYEGVNIVVFNQPVSKYNYSKVTDDFDYDTDYTKQIQSALKDAEEELEKKKKEEKANAGANAKANEKAKADSIAEAKAEAKAKLEEEQRQKAETKAQQASEAKAKSDSIAQAKKDSFAKTEEEKREQAKAKVEEEERRKAEAKVAEEERKAGAKAKAEEEERKKLIAKQEEEERKKLIANAVAGNDLKKSASAVEESDKKTRQNAIAIIGNEVHESEKSDEVPPNVSVENISETNRNIIKATVTKYNRETIYYKITYKWGGIFYFQNDRSISEAAFLLATDLK